jgi:hypothetical protein
VKLAFLGKSSDHGDSPTLYATDHDSYIIQGYTVADDAVLATLDVPAGETVVEVYARLFAFLAEDDVPGVVTRFAPPIVHVRENGNLVLQGTRLPEDAARFRLALPDHEDAIEVPKAALLALLGDPACV